MQLAHIELKDLKISKTNMRYRDPAPDVSDILPSIRQKGVLMPLLVRPEDGKFGVVAGRRRWFSLKSVKEEVGEVAAPPCAIMEEGDDLIFLPRIERTADDFSAAGLNLRNQRRELVSISASGENRKTFGRKFLRDRRADVITRSNHSRGSISDLHGNLSS